MQAVGRSNELGVSSVMSSVGSLMQGQVAAGAQLLELERQCDEMRKMLEEGVLGVRRAAGDDMSVGSSGSSRSSLVAVVEGEQVQPTKQGRGERDGDGANEEMGEGPSVSTTPGVVSGSGGEKEELGPAKKQKSDAEAASVLPLS